MLHETWTYGYVSTVGTNPNQIDFENSVLWVAVNTKFSSVPRTNQTPRIARKIHSILDVWLIPAPSSYANEM